MSQASSSSLLPECSGPVSLYDLPGNGEEISDRGPRSRSSTLDEACARSRLGTHDEPLSPLMPHPPSQARDVAAAAGSQSSSIAASLPLPGFGSTQRGAPTTLPAHAVRRSSVGRDPAADSPMGAPPSGAFYTVTVGHKASSAKNFVPGVNEVSELLKRLSSHTIVSKFSRLTSMPALHQPRSRAGHGLGAPSGPGHLAATIEED